MLAAVSAFDFELALVVFIPSINCFVFSTIKGITIKKLPVAKAVIMADRVALSMSLYSKGVMVATIAGNITKVNKNTKTLAVTI